VANAAGAVVYQGNDTVRSLSIAEGRSMVEAHSGSEVFMAVRNGNGTFVTGLGAANTGSGRLSNETLVLPTAYVPHDFRISFTAADTFDVINDTTGATVLAAQAYTPGMSVSFNGLSVSLSGTPAIGDEFTVEPSANQPVFATLDALMDTLRQPLLDDAGRASFNFAMDRSLQDIDRALEGMLEVQAEIGAKGNALLAQRSINEDMSIQLSKAKSDLEDVDPVKAISDLARHSQALEAAQQAFVKVQGLSLFNFLR
jgi:flagellar hook-associated protein 3 FlgL